MALYPAPDMRSGAIALWVRGERERRARGRAGGGARVPGRRRADGGEGSIALRAGRRTGRRAHAAARQVDLAPRGDRRGAMTDGATSGFATTCARPTPQSTLDAVAALGAEVVDAQPRGAGSTWRIGGRRACAARDPARPRSTSATRARCCACCRAGSPGRRAGHWTLDGDESIRRRPVDRVAAAAARDGRDASSAATAGCRRSGRGLARCTGIRYELPVASAQVKSCVLLAGLLAEGETTVVEPAAEPRPHRAHAGRGRRRACEPSETAGSRSAPRARSARRWAEVDVPGDFSSAAFFVVAATLVPGSELRLRGVGVNPTRTGLLASDGADGGDVELRAATRRRRRAGRRPRRAHAALRGHHRRARGEVPLADRRAAAGRAARRLRRGRRRSCAEPRSCATRNRTGSRPSSRRCAALGARDRGDRGRLRRRGQGRAATAARSTPHGDHRLAMLGAVAGPRLARGSRGARASRPQPSRIRASPTICADLGAVEP